MSEENKELTQKEIDERDFQTFLVTFGFGCGFAAVYLLFRNVDLPLMFDLERKKYTPIVVENNLYVVNQKNGKTYKLEEKETTNTYFYEYKYLTAPKSKKVKIYSKKDPLDILKNNKQEAANKLKNAGYSDEKIQQYLKQKGWVF